MLGPRQRERHRDLRQPGEPPRPHPPVRRLEPGRVRVRPHEPQRGLVRHALGMRDRPEQRPTAPARAAQHRGQHRRRAPARRAAPRPLRRQRLRPQPGRRDRRHRPCAAGAAPVSSATQPPSELPATSNSRRQPRPRERRARARTASPTRRAAAAAQTRRSPACRPPSRRLRNRGRARGPTCGGPRRARGWQQDERQERVRAIKRRQHRGGADRPRRRRSSPRRRRAGRRGRARSTTHVAHVAGDRRRQQRLQRRAGQDGGDASPCSADLARAEAAQRDPRRVVHRPEPRLRDLVRRDEQRRAVGDARTPRHRRASTLHARHPGHDGRRARSASAVARCPRQRGLPSTICTFPIRRSVKPASQNDRYSRQRRRKRSS